MTILFNSGKLISTVINKEVMKYMDNFKIKLKAARVNAEMTAKDVAENIGKTEKTVLNWENGITAIPAEQFNNLCKLYNIKSDHVEIPIVKDNFFCE